MEITETFYAPDAKAWRKWLSRFHKSKKEIWLIYFNKKSGRPRLDYHDAVDEAICFGWIDSTIKKIDEHQSAQRFTPRKAKSKWSELNKHRAAHLIQLEKMTEAGMAALNGAHEKKFPIPSDLIREIKKNKSAWKHFQNFPEIYRLIRLAYLDDSRKNPEVFNARLKYFLKMTEQGKTFGWMPDN